MSYFWVFWNFFLLFNLFVDPFPQLFYHYSITHIMCLMKSKRRGNYFSFLQKLRLYFSVFLPKVWIPSEKAFTPFRVIFERTCTIYRSVNLFLDFKSFSLDHWRVWENLVLKICLNPFHQNLVQIIYPACFHFISPLFWLISILVFLLFVYNALIEIVSNFGGSLFIIFFTIAFTFFRFVKQEGLFT